MHPSNDSKSCSYPAVPISFLWLRDVHGSPAKCVTNHKQMPGRLVEHELQWVFGQRSYK